MAKNIVPVLLNQGLDLATPSVLAKEGSLSECLNYEMTGDFGYKRIDGYERFDGYPNGAFVGEFYQVTLSAVDPGTADLINVGATLSRPVETTTGAEIVGNLINNFYGNQVGYLVEEITSTTFIYAAYDADGALQDGETVYFSAGGTLYEATVVGDVVPVRSVVTDPEVYLTTVRGYMTTMRNAVQDTIDNICGCWWHDDALYLALDAPIIQFVADDPGNIVLPGSMIKLATQQYIVLTQVAFDSGDAPVPGEQRVAVLPTDANYTSWPTSGLLYETNDAGNNISTIASTSATMSVDAEYAYVVRCNTVEGSNTRGYTSLKPAFLYGFDAGTYSSEALPTTGWVLRTADGTKTINCSISYVTTTSGTFAGANAAGTVVITNLDDYTGGSLIKDNWELWYGGARRMTINTAGGADGPQLAGSKRLNIAGTRYQTVNANFFGNEGWNQTYGATGASRAFWADEDSFGVIYAVDDDNLDQPKYVAYHAGRLALGYAVGSVLRSAVGEPFNWSGVDGAQEIATGDRITGLLEVSGDTLIVFGRNSIRRLAADGTPTTISSDAGAFDYTAVMAGQEIIYTGVSGISTLSQTSAYGDFEGERASSLIQQWLRTRLLVDNTGFETGGVAMALPCRNKNQYRLFLKNGTVIFMTLTSEGYKAMKVNYGNGNDLRVPFAWSSAVAHNGKERIHVVWDYTLASRGLNGVVGNLPERKYVYEMDSGWGFDGEVFEHYFDTNLLFLTAGQTATGIHRVRLHGRGYGVASLKIRTASLEDGQPSEFSNRELNLSLPRNPVLLLDESEEFTTIADHANWGLGIKLRIEGSNTLTEPSHVCQVLLLHTHNEGAVDA